MNGSHRRQRRPLAFRLHSLLGLKLSLLTLFVCLTGTLAVVSDEIDWLLRPAVRATATDTPATWGEQLAAARRAYPGHVITFAIAGEEPYLATRFSATDRSGDQRVIYVDPAGAVVRGEADWISVVSVLRALHYLLFAPGDWGFFLVTSLGGVLAGALVTGLITYKKFWRGFFRLPRTAKGARVLWGDVHRLIGLWSIWFVFLMAVTSLWYLGERVLYRAGVDLDVPRPAIAEEVLDAMGPEVPRPLPLDSLIARASVALPGLSVRQLWLPTEPESPLAVRGQAAAWLVRDRANGVEVNPLTGAIMAVDRVEDMTPLGRWVQTADPLHFGDFAGLASKLVWVGFGLLLSLSALTGVLIYLRRLRSAPSLIRLRFLGPLRWPSLVAVGIVPVGCFLLFWLPGTAADGLGAHAAGSGPVGRWQAEAGADRSPARNDDRPVRWRVRLCVGCYDLLREAALAYGDAAGPDPAARRRLAGDANRLSAVLPPLSSLEAPRRLWLVLRDWSGAEHTVSWPLFEPKTD